MAEFGSSQLQVIQDAVNTISSSGIANLQSSLDNLKWWESYVNADDNTFNLTGTGAFQTVKSINGAGYITEFMVRPSAVQAIELKITIDGVLKFHGKGGLITDCGIGLFSSDFLVDINYLGFDAITGVKQSMGLDVGERPFPYTLAGGNQDFHIFDEPLFFKTSLLVEVKFANTNKYGCRMKGGVLA